MTFCKLRGGQLLRVHIQSLNNIGPTPIGPQNSRLANDVTSPTHPPNLYPIFTMVLRRHRGILPYEQLSRSPALPLRPITWTSSVSGPAYVYPYFACSDVQISAHAAAISAVASRTRSLPNHTAEAPLHPHVVDSHSPANSQQLPTAPPAAILPIRISSRLSLAAS